jgi:hypothetical protein
VQSLANLLGKVNANGALVVTLDGGTATATTMNVGGVGSAGTLNIYGSDAGGTGAFVTMTSSDGTLAIVGGQGDQAASNSVTINSSLVLGSAQSLQWGSSGVATPDVALSRGAANRLDLATGDSLELISGGLGVGVITTTAGNVAASGAYQIGAAAAATSIYKIVKKVTGIADNSATAVLTVTVPNANHAAAIKLTLLSSNGSTDAFESSRTAQGAIVLARTTGVTTVATAATLTLTGIATVAAGATHTLAYGVTAMSGAAGATQTFDITVTIDDSGNLGSNQVVVLAELINAEATGVTVA